MMNGWLDSATLARQIVNLRTQAKWSQTELAERCGLSRTYISLIERGEATNPTLAALRSIFVALGYESDSIGVIAAQAQIAQLVEGLSAIRKSRQIALAITKLEEAGLWLSTVQAEVQP